MNRQVEDIYGHRLRLRVCGLCWRDDALLLANHRGLTSGDFWAPPGGGVEFGEHLSERLAREFHEETRLLINVGSFRFGCEYIEPPLHAVELFFEAGIAGGKLEKGDDPELPMIEDVRFLTPAEISRLPPESLHGIFRHVESSTDLKKLTGFFRI